MAYTVVDIEAGSVVFDRGDEGDVMYLVQAGEVEVLRDLDDDPRPLAVFERGDFFGEMAILERQPRTHAVRARTDAKLVKIDAGDFAHMLTRNPEIAVRMIRKLSRRLTATEEKLFRAWRGEDALGDDTHATGRRRARLVHLAEGRPGAVFPLGDGPESTVGRLDPINGIHPDVDLTAIDQQLSTSRRHARFLRRDGKLLLVEDKATNGTFVNGRRLVPTEPVELHGGEAVTFGAVHMRLLVD
ncbi:MAG: FHA domain-containing protein [Acidobacteria bacterium]|nr:MAG: FHA domain-containing protein [Acidobacteriota bacterium]